MRTRDDDVKETAEAKFKRKQAQTEAGAQARIDYDASIVARDANTARLRALRLTRDRAERESASGKSAAADSRSP